MLNLPVTALRLWDSVAPVERKQAIVKPPIMQASEMTLAVTDLYLSSRRYPSLSLILEKFILGNKNNFVDKCNIYAPPPKKKEFNSYKDVGDAPC